MQRCLTQYQLKYKVQEDLTDHMKDRKLASGGGWSPGWQLEEADLQISSYLFIYLCIHSKYVC